MSRLPSGGLIDRSQPLSFRFDGRTLRGFQGDTLASALLANDVRLVARSFKYHRPRGILTAGSEEPNALMQLGQGDQTTPNVRATTQELFDGLIAASQNRYPSLRFDLLGINDLLSPFFSAGFYYKTFMWPKSFWEKLYEPLIRRAAGLGMLSGKADTARYEKAFAHCDLLVIGAGPAGLMAALTAGQAGLDVILADEDFALGGRLIAETLEVDGMPGRDWVKRTSATLLAMPNVRLMPRTTITGAYDGGTYGALQRVSHHLAEVPQDAPLETFWRIVARRTILAAGAIERPIAFPNNDRPGIMMASAVRSYANRFAVAPGQRVTVFTNNDDGHRTALDLTAQGITVAAVIDTRDGITSSGDYPVIAGAQVTGTRGRQGLSGITVQTASGSRSIETDCLAVSGGWNPTVHLTCHMNGRPVWREDIAAFVPREGAVPNLHVAGAARGEFTTHGALTGGLDAARAVGADEFIMALPDGYDTDVNKRGGRVSAGQRQLISFARAFIASPRVLILDEATASLDIPSERLVQHGLKTLLAGRTAIIIAHRLSTVSIADRVLVMEHGRIIEDDTPAKLIAGTGKFAKMHKAWRDSLV